MCSLVMLADGNVPLESKLLSLCVGTDPSLGAPFFSLVTHPKHPPVLVLPTLSQVTSEGRGEGGCCGHAEAATSSWGLQLAEALTFLGSALGGFLSQRLLCASLHPSPLGGPLHSTPTGEVVAPLCPSALWLPLGGCCPDPSGRFSRNEVPESLSEGLGRGKVLVDHPTYSVPWTSMNSLPKFNHRS